MVALQGGVMGPGAWMALALLLVTPSGHACLLTCLSMVDGWPKESTAWHPSNVLPVAITGQRIQRPPPCFWCVRLAAGSMPAFGIIMTHIAMTYMRHVRMRASLACDLSFSELLKSNRMWRAIFTFTFLHFFVCAIAEAPRTTYPLHMRMQGITRTRSPI